MKNKVNPHECHPKILGGFPPPVTGNSASLLAITLEVEKVPNVHVKRLDVSTGKLTRSIFAITGKFRCYFQHWLTLLRPQPKINQTLYMVCEGDKALIFTLLTIIIARLSGHSITLHHHSFSYINSHRLLMRATNFYLGKNGVHVFLSDGMANKFFQTYPFKRAFIVNHNLGQLDHFQETVRSMTSQQRRADGPLVVGMLSNLMKAKGLDTFIAIAEKSAAAQLPIRFELAGPPVSKEDTALIERAKKRLGDQFCYKGALYGPDKDLFLKELDIFVFPTRYHHEAQPIVLLEALCNGCAVISTDRGCIAEDMAQMGGIAIPREDASDPNAYLAILRSFVDDKKSLEDFRTRAIARTQDKFEQVMHERTILINRICALPYKENFSNLDQA